jgi:hypothetical protein
VQIENKKATDSADFTDSQVSRLIGEIRGIRGAFCFFSFVGEYAIKEIRGRMSPFITSQGINEGCKITGSILHFPIRYLEGIGIYSFVEG